MIKNIHCEIHTYGSIPVHTLLQPVPNGGLGLGVVEGRRLRFQSYNCTVSDLPNTSTVVVLQNSLL